MDRIHTQEIYRLSVPDKFVNKTLSLLAGRTVGQILLDSPIYFSGLQHDKDAGYAPAAIL